MSTVHFDKDSAGEWRWYLKATNGETLAVSSEGYTRLHDAHRGWDDSKRAAREATPTHGQQPDPDVEQDPPPGPRARRAIRAADEALQSIADDAPEDIAGRIDGVRAGLKDAAGPDPAR